MPSISRRRFLQGALTTSFGLPLLGGYSQAGFMPIASASSSGPFDVAIVGAGLAGLAAAQLLLRAGKNIVVLEARNRIGGRTSTDNKTFFPGIFDRGAQFFHQATDNPLVPLARAAGIELLPQGPPQFRRGTTVNPPEALLALLAVDLVNKKEEEVGKKIQDGLQEDVSMAQATADLVDVPFYGLAASTVEASNVTVLDDLSTLDTFKESLRQGPGADIQVKGMGNFVRTVFGSGVPVHLNTPVTSIGWGGSNGVRLKTRAGIVYARAAIVTVPAGILSSGRLRFNPQLPAEHQTAIGQLRMGVLNKIAVGFSKDIFGPQVSTNTVVLPLRDTNLLPFLVTQLWDQNVALCFVGPVLGVELEKAGRTAMIAFALSQVAEMFGSSSLKAFNGRATVTQWLSNPWTLGSYSYVEPGDAGARTMLATPVDNRIFFAGEALSELSHSTVWGRTRPGRPRRKRSWMCWPRCLGPKGCTWHSWLYSGHQRARANL